MTSPDIVPLIVYAKAWTPGTNGIVTGKCVRVNIEKKEDFEKYRGKLAGVIVIFGPDAEVKPITEAPFKRYTDDDLAKDRAIPDSCRPSAVQHGDDVAAAASSRKISTSSSPTKKFSQSSTTAAAPPAAALSSSSLAAPTSPAKPPLSRSSPWPPSTGRASPACSTTKKTSPSNSTSPITFYDDDPMQYDTIAEIPGTDKKDEVVMLGAHLDSWHAGTGATDNGAGTIVMMEAVRILKALDIKPRRTIRIGLWSGEEEGLLGSQGYVEAALRLAPAHRRSEHERHAHALAPRMRDRHGEAGTSKDFRLLQRR